MIILSSSECSDLPSKLDDLLSQEPVVRLSSTPISDPPPPIHPLLKYGAVTTLSPPEYNMVTVQRPLSTITYTFRPDPARWHGMILEAPQDLEGSYPSYYIAVNMNCLTPTSYITTVRRGSEPDGEVVGEFEIGLISAKKSNTVCIRDNEFVLGDVLKAGHQLFRNEWHWKTVDYANKPINLFWDDTSAGIMACFSSKDRTSNTVLARFVPPVHLRKAGRPAELNRLEVLPQGHDVFDDILISALILVRLRTNPA